MHWQLDPAAIVHEVSYFKSLGKCDVNIVCPEGKEAEFIAALNKTSYAYYFPETTPAGCISYATIYFNRPKTGRMERNR